MGAAGHDRFEAVMQKCVSLGREAAASGNYGLGAMVVREGAVLGESASGLVKGTDPTAHPEIVAIRTAAERVGSRYLPGAYLITTLEPCPMCTAAAIWAKMGGIVYGAAQPDALHWAAEHPDTTFTWRQIEMRARDVVRAGHPLIELYEGVCRDDCLALFPLTASRAREPRPHGRRAPAGGGRPAPVAGAR
ncbi:MULTISPECIES: nucleoside deaminase [Streptomyces]|uniref:nucleoside deaminase n=1 Tax=Streptomyces TaxID=1883 RepID=UPI001D155C5B|nr:MULTISPECIES: nucleoside deaminase [Streptomyces]MCC3654617.1 nucleoside deaminase [Streptomyces sp. S07_1.15]WSQ70986.1 nucleoside deaminase [Streptomyces xinghaiensis]